MELDVPKKILALRLVLDDVQLELRACNERRLNATASGNAVR